jgi:hypothetical protein
MTPERTFIAIFWVAKMFPERFQLKMLAGSHIAS